MEHQYINKQLSTLAIKISHCTQKTTFAKKNLHRTLATIRQNLTDTNIALLPTYLHNFILTAFIQVHTFDITHWLINTVLMSSFSLPINSNESIDNPTYSLKKSSNLPFFLLNSKFLTFTGNSTKVLLVY